MPKYYFYITKYYFYITKYYFEVSVRISDRMVLSLLTPGIRCANIQSGQRHDQSNNTIRR